MLDLSSGARYWRQMTFYCSKCQALLSDTNLSSGARCQAITELVADTTRAGANNELYY